MSTALKVPRHRQFVFLVRATCRWRWNRAFMEWRWQGKTEVLGEKPVPVPLHPPQIPHGRNRYRTSDSAVLKDCSQSEIYLKVTARKTHSVWLINTSLKGVWRRLGHGSRRPLTAEARVRSEVSSCKICGGQSGSGPGFIQYVGFLQSASLHQWSIHISFTCSSCQKDKRTKSGKFKKGTCFRK